MSESFVVRLVTAGLETGDLAGELEVIATGEHVAFRSAGELVEIMQSGALARRRASTSSDEKHPAQGPPA